MGKVIPIKPRLSLIMVASDGLELTCQALRSLREFTKMPYEIIVIDNASTDGTKEWLESQKDIRIVLHTGKLVSYGTAVNMGLREASDSSKYLAVLNNDLIFTDSWDARLIEAIEHPEWLRGVEKIGIAGPMSNHVAGFQLFKNARYNLSTLGEFSRELYINIKKNGNRKTNNMIVRAW